MNRRIVFLSAMAVVACNHGPAVSTRTIVGPDGGHWWSIRCRGDIVGCWDEAAFQCPQGYVTADKSEEHGSMDRTYFNTYTRTAITRSDPTYIGHLLIKCRDDEGDGDKTRTASRPPERAPASEPSCSLNYATFDAMASTWAQWFDGKPNEQRTPWSEFADICSSLPETAQRCISADFAIGHRGDCIDIIRRLPTETRHALDRLYVTRMTTSPSTSD